MEYLFVYGLFRDQSKTLLGDCTFCGKASITGKLYRVSEFYPGFNRHGDGKVWGDVYMIDPIIFPKLDEFEGHEYIRTKIRTSTDIDCWIYEYKYDTFGFKEVKGGDWMLR
jgi:gamma-glutamylcyclotransferase (GGCT)/AIG2-like uncharacterized protein YtfP